MNHHDLQVFVSKTEISPSASKCDQKLAAPHSIVVCAEDKKNTFKHTQNIYISFYSEQGTQIQVSTKFVDIHEHRNKKKEELQDKTPVQFDFDDNPHDDPFYEIKQQIQ